MIHSKKYILIVFLTLIALLATPASGLAAQASESLVVRPDQVVLGDNYTLEDGQTVDGNLFVLGGNVDLRQGSRVTGDVLLMGGNLRVRGVVDGDIIAAGGQIRLYSEAVVRGDIRMVGASLDRDPGAQVGGTITDERRGPFNFNLPTTPRFPSLMQIWGPIGDLLSFLFTSFLLAALAILVVMFAPKQAERVASISAAQPLISGGLGLATLIAALSVMLVLTILIITIPVSLLLGLLLGVALLFGWIAVGLEVGRRLAVLFKTEWAPPIAAGIGTLVISIILGGVGRYVFCIGWLFPFLASMIGLGGVLLTRFGSQPYPVEAGPSSSPPRGPVYPVATEPPPSPSAPRPGSGIGPTGVYDAPDSPPFTGSDPQSGEGR
jgi:hypothetical protein